MLVTPGTGTETEHTLVFTGRRPQHHTNIIIQREKVVLDIQLSMHDKHEQNYEQTNSVTNLPHYYSAVSLPRLFVYLVYLLRVTTD